MKSGSIFVFSLVISAAAVAQPANQARFVDVIVALNVDATRAPRAVNQMMANQVAAEHGVQNVRTYGTVFAGFAGRLPEAALNALQHDPMIAAISFDGTMHASMGKPGGGGGGGGGGGETVPWGVARIGAAANPNDGAGIHVYIIDTGIDSDHRDLAAHIGNGFAAVTCRGRTCLQPWDDDNGHGTHVSGSAGAIDNDVDVIGVAPGVTLHAIKVLSKSGSGSTSGIIQGIDWMAAEVQARGQPAAANMSLGGSGSKTGTCTSNGFTGSDNFHRAICNAKNIGVVFAVAAGNEGADAQGSTPAAYDDAVITVSATDSSDNWPTWSNWGDNSAAWTANPSAPVAIAAPGVSVLSTWNNGATNTISGTSMATPHVAGAIALFLASNPQQNNGNAFVNARNTLLGVAESTAGFSNTSGHPHSEDFLHAGNL